MSGSKRRKRILVLCPHPERVAPGQRLKYEQYFDYLRSSGYDLVVSPFQTLRMWHVVYKKGRFFSKVFWVLVGYARRFRDLLRLPFYDGIFVFLQVTPLGPPLAERIFRSLARKVIYDIDDLVFMGKVSEANKLIGRIKGKNKPIYMMKCADHVLVGTPYLEEFVRKYNHRTTDISVTINTDVYVPKSNYRGNDRLVIGWSGSFSTSPYLRLLEGPLRELRKQVDFRLRVIGAPDFKMEGIEVEGLPWVETTEVQDLLPIDIGLYPLPDEQWVYGKSGGKALQYMGLGIPTIATAIGANFRIIDDGECGFLVKAGAEDEWLDRMKRLALDPALRERIGRNGRKRIEDRFSMRANRDRYLDLFKQVYGEPT
jgi:glycosyltransferase involved in cell wall biosynthesis